MPRLIYAVPCLLVITDQNTNLPTYVSIVERATTEILPFPLEGISVASNWFNDDGGAVDSLAVRVRVVSPDGTTLSERELATREIPPLQRVRINIEMNPIQVNEAGVFSFTVEHMAGGEWVTDADIPFIVEVEESRAEAEELS